MKNQKLQLNFYSTLILLGAFLLSGTACDTGVDANDNPERTTITGQVTNNETASRTSPDEGFSKSSSDEASEGNSSSVEGATVTAVAIHADGSVSALEGSATTNASGAYTLKIEGDGASDHVRVIANAEGGFESSVIVYVNGRSSVNARPMSFETHARAEVYLRAKSKDGSENHTEGVTTADIATYVNADVASEINAGSQNAAEIGTAIANAVKAQAAYNNRTNAGLNMNAIAMAKSQAFAQLQSEIAAAASANARATAIAKFEEAYLNIFTEHDASAQTQAEMHQTSTAILVKASGSVNGNAQLGLRKMAEKIRAHTTALALEAKFKAESASQATVDALAEARIKMISEIEAAGSAEAIVQAKAEYKATVDTFIETTFGISSEVRAAAEAGVESKREDMLDIIAGLSILTGNVADAAANACAEFYVDARAETISSLTGLVNAEAVAEVIVTLSVIK